MKNATTTATAAAKSRTHWLTLTAMMTAVTCVLAPFSLPIGPVPISLTNLVIYFSLYLLGWKRATVSYLVYLFIGLVGLPVFSGFTGGLAKLAGPTGGYIIGFIPMAILAGVIMEHTENKALHFLGMILGTAICYAFGTAWYCVVMNSPMITALGACVFPFIPGDIVKMLAAVLVCPTIQKRLATVRG